MSEVRSDYKTAILFTQCPADERLQCDTVDSGQWTPGHNVLGIRSVSDTFMVQVIHGHYCSRLENAAELKITRLKIK